MKKKFGKYKISSKFGQDENGSIKFGSGGCAKVYLATNEEEEEKSIKKMYVLKILNNDRRISVKQQKAFNNEIDTLINLSKEPDSEKYIPRIYDSLKYNVEKQNNNEIKGKNQEELEPFYVIDFISNGCLLYYIQSFFWPEDITTKLLFKKIVEAVQYLHSKYVCHLDLKPQNIILDKEFNPIIIDFGSAENFTKTDEEVGNLDQKNITRQFACPEIYKNERINGVKADIFSLGAILFFLFTGQYGFEETKANDLYNLIEEKKYETYWEKIKDYYEINNMDINLNVSKEFKELYFSLVANEPSERKTIKEILESDWLKEVNDFEKKDKKGLEKKYQDEFTDTLNSIRNDFISLKKSKKIFEDNFITKAYENKEYNLFKENNNNLIPKKIFNDEIQINLCIKINSDLSAIEIMNYLLIKISEVLQGDCIPLDDDLILKVLLYKDKAIGSCTMEIELFKYEEKEKYLLEFVRKEGTIKDYYHYFLEIKKMITPPPS